MFLFRFGLQDILATSVLQVNENVNNALITSFRTTDEDPADKHKYTLLSGVGKFRISGTQLLTTASANLNFEQQSKYGILVQSSDSSGASMSKSFTVHVLDVNEAPTSVKLSNPFVSSSGFTF